MGNAHECPFVGEQFSGSARHMFHISRIQEKEHGFYIQTTTLFMNQIGTLIEDESTNAPNLFTSDYREH